MAHILDSGRAIGSNSDIEAGLEIAASAYTSLTSIHKFGSNENVGTTYVPITDNGIYQTPQVSGATTLRVKAGGNANDTAAGSGAREITLVGLDETGAEVTETVATAGASASFPTTTTFIRLYRAWVSASGTYATSSAGSHSAAITIENGGGTADWATISNEGFPHGQSEIACYTVPLGYTAYIKGMTISVDSTKAASILAFNREGVLDTVAPYKAMRVFLQLGAVSGEEQVEPKIPLGPFPELTDIGFMAKLPSGSGEVDIDFEILLLRN